MKRVWSLLVCFALLVSFSAACAVEATPGALYDDVPDSHWGILEITQAFQAGIMTGVGERKFGLGEDLTRASFITMLCRMFGWEEVTPQTPTFIDCGPEEWCYTAVETAYANGALSQEISIYPDDPINRLDMAKMLVRALDYDQLAAQVEDYGTPFADVTRSGYATIAYDIGMVRGVEEWGKLYMKPNAAASREEAAAMLMRVYDRFASKLDWVHGFYALSSSNQINLAEDMDAVSFGWSQLAADDSGAPYLLTQRVNGNEWAIPEGADWAKSTLDASNTTYNLNVFSSIWNKITISAGESEVSSDMMTYMLALESRRQTLADTIAAAAEGYAGITIDFEGLGSSHRDQFSDFMQKLRAALGQGKLLYVCVMPNNYYTGYDFRALGQVCDKVIMMAHDYVPTSIPASYVGSDRTNYPEAPIHQVYLALQALTDPETGVEDLSKCALAISFAATAFPIDENGMLAGTEMLNPDMAIMTRRLTENQDAIGWSDTYRSPHITYQIEDGSWYKVWYEDARSVEDKILLARMFGVNGVSFWRLGQIPVDETAGIHYNIWSIEALESRE